MIGLFLTFIALEPKYKEDKVSSMFFNEGPILTIKAVLAFPPKESCKILVNFESRNGT